jgi:hypothetical protein
MQESRLHAVTIRRPSVAPNRLPTTHELRTLESAKRDAELLADRQAILARIISQGYPIDALTAARKSTESASERCIRVARDCGRIANA